MIKKEIIRKKVKFEGRKTTVKKVKVVKKVYPIVDYAAQGTWHGKRTIIVGNTTLNFAGVIMGCGLGQLQNVSTLSDTVTKEQFIKALSPLKPAGVGAVISTLGQNYFSREPYLLSLGFTRMEEYPNYQHGQDGRYTQRIYILKL